MSNYSYLTSLPAYHEAPDVKKRQAEMIFSFIVNGANNLLQISELVGLPQSTVAGRITDLKNAGKVEYEGFVFYKDRKRKKICATRVQAAIF